MKKILKGIGVMLKERYKIKMIIFTLISLTPLVAFGWIAYEFIRFTKSELPLGYFINYFAWALLGGGIMILLAIDMATEAADKNSEK